MTFGRSPGPPATARQLTQLSELIQEAGHVDFADARGPLGLNQRQAGGRFTRDEADELIARLEHEADVAAGRVASTGESPHDNVSGQGRSPARERGTPPKRSTSSPKAASTTSGRDADRSRAGGDRPPPAGAGAGRQARNLRTVPTELLAAELQRRGWIVVEP
ncbi:MAG: hypothetical protein JJU45_01055 [Acidimicrobiia bacterium]|nr:hypothetical protein [Acidimicrobiia bacterium]